MAGQEAAGPQGATGPYRDASTAPTAPSPAAAPSATGSVPNEGGPNGPHTPQSSHGTNGTGGPRTVHSAHGSDGRDGERDRRTPEDGLPQVPPAPQLPPAPQAPPAPQIPPAPSAPPLPPIPAHGSGWVPGGPDGGETLGSFVSTPARGTPLDPAGHPGGDEDSVGMRIPMPAQTGPEADRLRYVGAATRRIARGLDLDEILLGLCRSAVPAFADAILVYLRDPLPVGDERPSGPLRLRLRRADGGLDGPDPAGDAPVGAVPLLPTLEPAYSSETIGVLLDGPLAEVLRGVRPVFADSPRAADALAELLGNPVSLLPTGRRALLAPLRGRRRVIGAAVLLRRNDRPAFEADDLLVAAQLATHTALGVDKAVLYGREAYIADALQREMLPDSLPQPTGVQLASRYLPAAESARVGGDWYDAIPLPGSRVALVVGDVMGHSMTSAAIMGQLRTTVQTLAGLDLAPQEVLYHLDEQAQRLGQDRMATCVYAVYDPIAHRLVVANAGHPPPVLLHADGLAEVLRVPPGAPIGVGGVPFEAVELPAPAGATLLLYTDGLVESRSRDVWGGIELLRERLHDAATVVSPPPLEPLCDEVLEILGPGDRDDDIALLAARFAGIAPSDVAYWFLEPQAQTAGRARRLVRQALRRWDLDDQLDAAELLVSEIVTNAVRYAERPITLRLLRTDVLRCEVGDDAPLLPRMRHAAPEEEGGRGLYLVNRMAQRWGATRLGAGKVVWFELPII
ncbi:Serine phosphatase RsbU, regulator of sigma subunit [Actinacidiphila rubida]|uniref:protein-serine/threonine phosphatase n=2 Tax=Actinacidiphila rubida TaxID=310780 RepID=A0A1H8HGB0_9ACTN|nr:SpoIIE family protein phosphatase [Actinacidiphila rubida]SEN55272.1 Serine phosphatase RsbU, regulator of sigma subunit [Actinacidiphila rubida]